MIGRNKCTVPLSFARGWTTYKQNWMLILLRAEYRILGVTMRIIDLVSAQMINYGFHMIDHCIYSAGEAERREEGAF